MWLVVMERISEFIDMLVVSVFFFGLESVGVDSMALCLLEQP